MNTSSIENASEIINLDWSFLSLEEIVRLQSKLKSKEHEELLRDIGGEG